MEAEVKRTFLLALALACGAAQAANAAAPCDFKGLSVGDKATPREIMKHLGIDKFKSGPDKETQAEHDAAFDALMKRADIVGSSNATEERDLKRGPYCDSDYCQIPYGVSVGNSSNPIGVGVFVGFDKSGMVEEIDVSYDWLNWDEVLELLNNKYGDNWRVENDPMPITNFETKKTVTVTRTTLTHRTLGQNAKTGDKCSLTASSHDIIFEHSLPPMYKSYFAIKLISKNF
jgi:hypothetical protein